MQAHTNAIEKSVKPFEIEAPVCLPDALCLRFADKDDMQSIRLFLSKQHHQEGSGIAAHIPLHSIEQGRVVILTNPFTSEIFGLASAAIEIDNQAKARFLCVNTAFCNLPFAALSHIMIAALFLKEHARYSHTIFYDDKALIPAGITTEKYFQTYLERLDHIKCITLGASNMLLHIRSALEEIYHLRHIRESLKRRCGA